MRLVDVKVGQGLEFTVDEAAGLLTMELKGTVLGQPEDVKIPISIIDILVPLEAAITNPFAKWAFGLLLALL